MRQGAATTAANLTGGVFAAGVPQTNLLTALKAITNGGFRITVDGRETLPRGLNFAAATTLTQCGAIIAAAMQGATAVWNAGAGEFVFTSNTTGATSTISFCTAIGAPYGDVAATCLLRTADGGTLTQGTQAFGAQWVPCDGRLFQPNMPMTQTPHAGTSLGNGRDYVRNVGRHGGGWPTRRGSVGKVRIPYDPTRTWYVSISDHNGEANLSNPPTVMNPPAGVR